jgi:competence protein ComGC
MWRRGSRGAAARPEGFTLLELLVVTTIIIILLGAIVSATLVIRKKTRIRGCERVITQVKIAISAYHGIHKAYPPDGIDTEVTVYNKGIVGSQCLIYYLATPQPKARRLPNGKIHYEIQEPFLQDLQALDLTFPIHEIESREEIPELLDGFGNPILYDRVARADEYSYPMPMPPSLAGRRHPDPRPEDGPTVPMGKYQAWSLGQDGLDVTGDPENDIKSWELQ